VSLFVKCLKIIGGIVAIAAAGILVGWWNTRGFSQKVAPTGNETIAGNLQPAPLSQKPDGPSIEIASAAPVARSMDHGLITNWNEQLDKLLNSPSSNREKIDALLAIFPRLPDDGQTEVAATLSTLLPDAEYGQLGQYLTNSGTAEPVREVLMSELLNRPDPIRLPWLLEVARSEQGPEAAEARGLLTVLLEEDNGTDWQRWQTEVEQHLQKSQ
jgi:hypothetical protein